MVELILCQTQESMVAYWLGQAIHQSLVTSTCLGTVQQELKRGVMLQRQLHQQAPSLFPVKQDQMPLSKW